MPRDGSKQGYVTWWRSPGYCDSPHLDYLGEFQLLKFHPLIRSFARICGRECSLVFGLESRVTILLKRGRSGDEVSGLSLTFLRAAGQSTISLDLSVSEGKIAVAMPIPPVEMGPKPVNVF